MASAEDVDDAGPVPPDEVFSRLGNDTRIKILQTLGEAEGPLSFSDLCDRVGLRHGGQFNYHLDQLVGHFVSKSGEGYALRRPGSRVVQALLSGAVTEDPQIKPTELTEACYHCGGSVLLKFSDHLALYCANCGGNFQLPGDLMEDFGTDQFSGVNGLLGGYELPPAGIEGRTIDEIFRAGVTWANIENLTAAADLCPRCSANIGLSVHVCETHEPTDGICPDCNARQRVLLTRQCQKCPYARQSFFSRYLLSNTELLNFLTEHGLNPVDTDSPWALETVLATASEQVLALEPFEGEFTFRTDEESITLTVNDELSVVGVGKSQESSG